MPAAASGARIRLMKRRIAFQWIDNCANERLRNAQERLLKNLAQFGIEPALIHVGKDLVKFSEVLRFARQNASEDCFVWCNSDVYLTKDPFEITDRSSVHGFHRTERPSGEICFGVDMYLIPTAFWDEYLDVDMPDLWCGATHIDWWLSRSAALAGRYETHIGYIDHPSHEASGASKQASNPYYRHNVRVYNAWARRRGAGLSEIPFDLPLIGSSPSPLRDYWRLLSRKIGFQ